MKGKFSSMGRVAIALVLALSLSLVTAVPVSAASITTVTPTDITVGTAYTDLTGPVLVETSVAEFTVGTIILTAPTGFEFDTGSDVTATVTVGDLELNSASSQVVTPLAGTITIDVSAVSTVASTITYTGIKIRDTDNTSGDTGNLVFSGGAGVTGSAGTLTSVPDVVATLTVEVQPTAAVAGVAISPAVTVKAVDAYDNVIAGESIAASLQAGVGVLSGTTPQVTNASGIATFSNLSINLIGIDKQLRFAAGAVIVDSGTFAITAAAVATLTVEVQPTAAVAGVAISPAVQVKAVDAYDNVIAGESIAASLQAGVGVLSGTTPQVTNASGIATFDNLSINLIGIDKQLRFAAGAVTVDSGTFAITAAVVATLTVEVQPTAAVAGVAISPAVQVKAVDAYDNVIAGESIAASLQVGVGVLSGTTPQVTNASGIATFDNLSINLVGSDKQLRFTAGTANVDSSTFAITAAVVATLTVEVQPTAAVAGVAISPAVTVKAVDAYDNVIAGESIAASLQAGVGVLSGTTPQVTNASGIATFDNLSINLIGIDKQLRFAAGAVTVDSSTFAITPAAFAGYTVVPAAGPYEAGTAFDVTITAVDGFDNPVGAAYATDEPYTWVTTASDAPDTTSPVIGTLAAVDFTDGVATKSVTLYAAESGVTFTVTDDSAATGTSAGIAVVPAAVDTLTVEEQPTAAGAGVAIAPAVEVKAVDEYGNLIEGESIAASKLAGAGTLSGTTPQLTDATGIATFDDLSIDLVGADKQLQFTAGTVTVDSDVFAITVGAVATLTVVAEPTGTVAGVAIGPVTVLAEDAFSNPVEGVSIAVTEAGAYTFDAGTLSQATGVDGIATFADLVINTAAVDYQLHFAAGAVTVDSALFDVLPAQADSFVFDAIVTQDAGVAFAITITAIDVYGNTDTGYAGPATLSDLTGTIDPGVTGAFIDGVWTDNVTILLAYTANTITATDALVTGTSDPFDVAPYPVYNTTTGQGYLTIQAAIDDASSGNTITVGPGTYVGDITISETLTLVSSGGPTVTKLTGTGAGPVVTIDDFNVTVDGFEIDPGTDGIFIDTISAGNVVTIQNQVIYDNTEQGIDVGEVYGTLNVFDCIIAANASEGVYIDLVDDGGVVVMTGNKIGAWTDTDYDLAGNGNEGVYIDFVNDGSTVTIGGATTAEANFICDNSSYGIDVYMVYYGSTLTIEGNVIGSYAPGGFTLAGNGSYGVYVEYVDFGSDLTITGNTINDNSGDGIYIDEVGWDGSDPATEAEYYALFQTYGANNVTIEGNTARRNDCEGIYVYYMEFASTLTIQDNTLSDNDCDGMYIAYYGGDSGTFYDNPATYPAYFGPVVLVKGNTITDNEDYGIYCDEYSYGTSVTIEDNLISGNWDGGIYHCCGPEYGSTVTIRGNTIVSNDTDENGYGNIYMSDYIEYGSTYIVEDNFIAGSTYYGVYISYVDYDSTLIIRGNTIGAGIDAQGNAYAGNYYEAVYIEYVEYDSTVEITRNDICGNEDDAIYIDEIYDNSSVSVTCNNICDNYYYALEVDYLYDDGSSLNVHYNNISGNDDGGYGIYHNDYGSDYVPVNATHNWWGDASGPYESSYNPDGLGDEVSDLVIFSPWLTSPSVCQVRTTLAAGWNTLSTPIALDSASDELAELGLDMAQAYAYSGGIWVLVTTANDNLEACGAFYVNMNSPAIIDFVPSAEITDPTTRTLPAGWSLVSMANLGSMTASEAMQTAFLVTGDLTGYAQVVSPAVNQPSWAFLRGGSSPPDMVPCKGYWLFMNNAGKLAGFTSTPIDLH